METTRVAINKPTSKEALKVWIKVAIYSFGGPAGQIAVMHKLLVEDKRWISENNCNILLIDMPEIF